MSAETFAHLACPNQECPDYGQRGGTNLRPHGWSTADKRVRCLRCTTCGEHFSERANTPLFGLRTSEETLVRIGEPAVPHLVRTFEGRCKVIVNAD